MTYGKSNGFIKAISYFSLTYYLNVVFIINSVLVYLIFFYETQYQYNVDTYRYALKV